MFSKSLIKYNKPERGSGYMGNWKPFGSEYDYTAFLEAQVLKKGMLCKYGNMEPSWLRGDRRMYPVTLVFIEDVVPFDKLEYTYTGKPKFVSVTTMYSRQNTSPFTRVDDGESLYPLSEEEIRIASEDAELQACLKKYKPDFVFPEPSSV